MCTHTCTHTKHTQTLKFKGQKLNQTLFWKEVFFHMYKLHRSGNLLITSPHLNLCQHFPDYKTMCRMHATCHLVHGKEAKAWLHLSQSLYQASLTSVSLYLYILQSSVAKNSLSKSKSVIRRKIQRGLTEAEERKDKQALLGTGTGTRILSWKQEVPSPGVASASVPNSIQMSPLFLSPSLPFIYCKPGLFGSLHVVQTWLMPWKT